MCKKRRHEPGANGKDKDYTWQRFENGRWINGLGDPPITPPLYRHQEIKNEPFVVLFESHTDVDRAVSMGLPSTTSGGSNSWRPEYESYFVNKKVAVIPDNDRPGAEFAATVCTSIYGTATSLRVLSVAPHPDFRRWADAGGTREQLLKLYESAVEYRPPSGAEILDSVTAFIRRFVSLTEAQSQVVALWVVHTYAFGAADCTPYLSINSAEKQSGKTRLLEILRLLVFNPWFTGRVTAPVLIRKIDAEKPSLLLDESDAAFGGEETYAEALRGVLNTGYRRGGCASVCVGQGQNIGYRDFSTYCPKAIAGIGKLPDTVADRSWPIRLKRAQRGSVERFRERTAACEAQEILAKLAAWCTANLERLRGARPEIPVQLSDRQADTSESLLAIADLASGDWPQGARGALIALCTKAQADDDSVGIQLLGDIKQVFAEKQAKELTSSELTEALAAIETSPWGEWTKGKPLSTAKLARLLKPFEVYPGQIQKGQARGYRIAQFSDAFARYLPPTSSLTPTESVTVSGTQYSCGSDEDFKVSNESASDTLKNAVSPNNHAGLRHFDTSKPEDGEKQEAPSGNEKEVEWEA